MSSFRLGRRYVLLCAALGIAACGSEQDITPAESPSFPAGFPEPIYSYRNNPVTEEGFELGRALFYDPILSKDGSVSCGSCHRQEAAFADPGSPVTQGVGGKEGSRNTPALANLRWSRAFFWDGGGNHLELVPLAPITNPLEMGENLSSVIRKLNRDPEYVQAFRKAFQHRDTVNSQQLFRALAQFMGELVSAGSPYDQFQNGKAEALTPEQKKGLVVFKGKCGTCHQPGLFTDHSFRNNGLDADTPQDTGRHLVTESPTDVGRFKVPSLRNVALTSPYMHDGRFGTLQQVLEHYDTGVRRSATLDPALDGPTPGIQLSQAEKRQLLAFLQSLTDQSFIGNKRFAAPRP
ncbi:cytochrome-c peroxidase [Rufibacter sediminis]|uniref:Cytochrome-c peroxidase n=1 Tax=Rufibacter sediminis TaxID=2762756 RepID=A0ABR6VMC0_9BACT|nr:MULTISPECIES: cytochrome c peroxidase [Rufibacter]MBC3538351.1 cytochrome-c peroxidase [Rufibacter sediminis]